MDNTLQWIGVGAASRATGLEIEQASRSDAKILITGESGVGKELVARLIHQRSRRRQAALVTINCASVTDSESELFGHLDKSGRLQLAHGGTLFLDEVAEMSLRMQARLLQSLETGEIHHVGADEVGHGVNVRIISSTNRDLAKAVAAREFREDLYYRLNVQHFHIPPLRERREDIPVLLDHFLRQFSESHGIAMPRLDDESAAQLTAADWPGNVRQLRGVADRLVSAHVTA